MKAVKPMCLFLSILLAAAGLAHYWVALYVRPGIEQEVGLLSWRYAYLWWIAGVAMGVLSIARREPGRWISAVVVIALVVCMLVHVALLHLPPM